MQHTMQRTRTRKESMHLVEQKKVVQGEWVERWPVECGQMGGTMLGLAAYGCKCGTEEDI